MPQSSPIRRRRYCPASTPHHRVPTPSCRYASPVCRRRPSHEVLMWIVAASCAVRKRTPKQPEKYSTQGNRILGIGVNSSLRSCPWWTYPRLYSTSLPSSASPKTRHVGHSFHRSEARRSSARALNTKNSMCTSFNKCGKGPDTRTMEAHYLVFVVRTEKRTSVGKLSGYI